MVLDICQSEIEYLFNHSWALLERVVIKTAVKNYIGILKISHKCKETRWSLFSVKSPYQFGKDKEIGAVR